MGKTGSTGKKIWIAIIVFSALVLFVMAMIFYFSAEDGAQSTMTSNGVTKFVLKLIRPDFDAMSKADRAALFAKASRFVRKAAHFTEYFFLGLFSSLLLLSVMKKEGKKPGALWFVPPVFCFLYAVFDEGHQRFVGGRAGQFFDVLIDFSGALLAVLIVFVGFLARNKRKPAL